MSKSVSLCLGLMSGTSMDGIDAALLETDGQAIIASKGGGFFPYPAIFQTLLKAAEMAAKRATGDRARAIECFPISWQQYLTSLQLQENASLRLESDALAYLSEQLSCPQTLLTFKAIEACSTELHYQACLAVLKQATLTSADIEVIGYHGQTLYHNPQKGITWQAGDPQQLANALNCQVVGAFRQADVAQGGQGAPLAPLYHQALVNSDGLFPAAVINCGGIANISLISGPDLKQVSAFDAGPGNVLLDRLMRVSTLGDQRYDHDGLLALQGTRSAALLALLKEQALPKNFLTSAPPKSLDSHDCLLPNAFYDAPLADALTTLAAFTAECLVDSLPPIQPLKYVILAGGGWYHPVILREFNEQLKARRGDAIQIITANQLGWQHDLLEAEAFAYLAKRSLLSLALSTPLTTGVKQALTGGLCFLPQTH